MAHTTTILNQLLHLLPRHAFEKSVSLHGGDRYVKYFSCWQQFVTLLYAHGQCVPDPDGLLPE